MPRYTLLQKIGQGGMGVVFKAKDEALDRIVALKLMTGPLAAKPEHVERFHREVAAAMKVSHASVVQVLDAGELDGQQYFTMEFVEGSTLSALKDAGPVETARALSIFRQILAALAHCHASGLVHRDVKPANIMVDQTGRAKLMDFGLVRDLDQNTMTASGQLLGSPFYLAPEVVLGQRATAASDQFSLGVTLWELLVGERAFPGDSLKKIAQGILTRVLPPPHEARPDCPPEFSRAVMRCLAKKPVDRFRSVADALTLLAPLRLDLSDGTSPDPIDISLPGVPAPPQAPPPAEPAPSAVTPGGRPRTLRPTRQISVVTPRLRPRRPWSMLAGTLALLGLGLTVATVMNSPQGPPVLPPSPEGEPTPGPRFQWNHGPRFIRARWTSPDAYAAQVSLTTTRSPRSASEREPTREHDLTCDDLDPGQIYTVHLTTTEGHEIWQGTRSTLSAAEVAQEAVDALARLAPASLSANLDRELTPLINRHRKISAEALASMRSRWQPRIAEARTASGIDVALAHLATIRDAVFSDGVVPAVLRRRLWSAVERHEDLRMLCDQAGIPTWEVTRARLLGSGHGPIDGARSTPTRGVVVWFDETRARQSGQGDPVRHMRVPHEDGHLRLDRMLTVQLDDEHRLVDRHLGPRRTMRLPDPVDLPLVEGWVEIHVLVRNLASESTLVLSAGPDAGNLAELAVFRGTNRGENLHRFRADGRLLGGKTYIQIELRSLTSLVPLADAEVALVAFLHGPLADDEGGAVGYLVSRPGPHSDRPPPQAPSSPTALPAPPRR